MQFPAEIRSLIVGHLRALVTQSKIQYKLHKWAPVHQELYKIHCDASRLRNYRIVIDNELTMSCCGIMPLIANVILGVFRDGRRFFPNVEPAGPHIIVFNSDDGSLGMEYSTIRDTMELVPRSVVLDPITIE